MLNEEQIRDALHASRVVPVAVPDSHGPFGLEQLAEVLRRVTADHPAALADAIERTVRLPLATWEKLDGLARTATRSGARRLSA